MAFKNNEKYAKAPPPETQLSLVDDTFKQAFGRSKGKRFFILHAPPPETQFSLVDDTFKQAFGRSKGKCFFIYTPRRPKPSFP